MLHPQTIAAAVLAIVAALNGSDALDAQPARRVRPPRGQQYDFWFGTTSKLTATGPALGFRKPGPSFRKHVKSSANSIIVGRRKCRGMLLHRHIGCFVRVGDRDVGGGVCRSVVGAWAAHPPALFR